METTITDKRGRVACPASFEFLDPLAAGYKLHFTTPAALAKHHGVCARCAARMAKKHAAVLAGKVETPANFEHHHHPTPEDHVGHAAPGEIVQFVNFNFDEIDDAMADASPDARQQAADVLRRVFQWCYPNNGKTPLRLAAARLAVLVSGITPALLEGKTLKEMATELGRTKAALSKNSIVTEKHFGVHFKRSRPDTSRARMAASALGHKPTNTKRIGGGGMPGGGFMKAITHPASQLVTEPLKSLIKRPKTA